MTDLICAFNQLRAALAPLGIEITRDVLALWEDRRHHGREPLPANALKTLAEVAASLHAQPPP
ncbi:MAG TPA: hypothetical protein VFU74_12975 [Actinocrinis sp.]|nr:hypothetical protein [Actinocrinis sp.]